MRASRTTLLASLILALAAPAAHAGLSGPTGAGPLDPSFGQGGMVTTGFSSVAGAAAVALQPDGRIVAVGSNGESNFTSYAVARYEPDGQLDTSFAGDGTLSFQFPGNAPGAANGVAIAPDGDIVIGGGAFVNGIPMFAAVRLNPDGTFDSSFGTNGMATARVPNAAAEPVGMALAPDGGVIVGGYSDMGTGPDAFAAVRFTPAGALDTTFGTAGVVSTTFPEGDAIAGALGLDDAGRLVISGHTVNAAVQTQMAIARYTPSGRPDPAFGGDGTVTVPFPNNQATAHGLALEPGGGMVLVGRTAGATGAPAPIAVARLRPNGALDRRFDGDGRLSITYPIGNAWGTSGAVESCGNILVTGAAYDVALGEQVFVVAALDRRGDLVTDYGVDGLVETVFSEHSAYLDGVALQPDGRLVAAGSVTGSGDMDFGLARYLGSCGDADTAGGPAPAVTLPGAAVAEDEIRVTGNTARVTLLCRGRRACRGTVELRHRPTGTLGAAAGIRRARLLGRRGYAVAAGRRVRVSIPLSGFARGELRRRGAVRAWAIVRTGGTSPAAITGRRAVRIASRGA